MAKPGKGAVDDNAIWVSHERAQQGAKLSAEAGQRITTSAAKQRTLLDAMADQARACAAKNDEIARAMARVRETLDRLALVALNAGLEGARLGETPGRPLTLVSDEVRGCAERGLDAVRELDAMTRDILRDGTAIAGRADEARVHASDIAHEAARASQAAGDAERALAEMVDRMRDATGSDPETVRAVAQATEHARALVTSLGALSGRAPRALLVSTLRPLLEPLLSIVEEEAQAGENE